MSLNLFQYQNTGPKHNILIIKKLISGIKSLKSCRKPKATDKHKQKNTSNSYQLPENTIVKENLIKKCF